MFQRKLIISVVKLRLRMNLSIETVGKEAPSSLKSDTKLEDLTREALIVRLRQSEAHVQQLRNILAKQLGYSEEKKLKPYDFSRFKKRHVLLKILYLGWNYHGFAGQNEGMKTVEDEIFKALKRSNLIESVEGSNYSRCGRTDKGVSAFSQVISVDVRTRLVEGKGIFTPQEYRPFDNKIGKEEIPYCQVLNRYLPQDIRAVAWAPVECNVNARFDCTRRTYKYYFPKGNLDLKKMQEASQLFLGEHDFRNMCKMNVKNSVIDYKRTILSVNISTISPCSDGTFQVCELTVVGHSFIWHQIRYMVSVLFLVGQGKESPEVVKELLDIEKHPGKPQYPMALDIPLVLFDCEFDNAEWKYDAECNKKVIFQLQNCWTEHIVKSIIAKRMAESLGEKVNIPTSFDSCHLIIGTNSQKHTPLLQRNVGETLEEKIERVAKRKKLDVQPIIQQQ